jgi:hypothetical protein
MCRRQPPTPQCGASSSTLRQRSCADLDARISVQAGKVADLTKQIADLDSTHMIEPPATGNLLHRCGHQCASGSACGSRQATRCG